MPNGRMGWADVMSIDGREIEIVRLIGKEST